jgi:hypothetical protein
MKVQKNSKRFINLQRARKQCSLNRAAMKAAAMSPPSLQQQQQLSEPHLNGRAGATTINFTECHIDVEQVPELRHLQRYDFQELQSAREVLKHNGKRGFVVVKQVRGVTLVSWIGSTTLQVQSINSSRSSTVTIMARCALSIYETTY